MRTRPFEPRDAAAAAALFTDYMTEIFTMPSALSPDVLLRDGQGRHFRLMLGVDRDDRPVGFAAWRQDAGGRAAHCGDER